MPAKKPPYGQHFLHDHNLLEAIVRAADLTPGTPVVEIGCGTGNLTQPLLQAGVSLTGVELDPSLLPVLRRRFGGNPGFRLVPGDITALPWEELVAPGRETVVMGNLPYAASTEVLFRMIAMRARVARGVFLVQWEVGQRAAAGPGGKDYGVLSVACQLWGTVRMVRKVPPSVFVPPPKVDSAVIRYDLSPQCLFPARDPEWTLKVVKAAFGQRRKTLVNALAGGKAAGKEEAARAIEKLGLRPDIRAERLSVAQFVELSNLLPPPAEKTGEAKE